MAKQNKKQRGEPSAMRRDQVASAAKSSVAGGASQGQLAAHPPAKHPTLLAVSVILFILWFVFLLFSALWG